ncbi:hypothetical protein NDU88_008340 [Pleurodeles waltl]|uniref:Uncharacterized protein n=1 Tax=Pleurodeles waltl TaxID=8319 RepID=A0AAV7NVT0_PLEWA|nr:hypothetical protein NDU88_008340 [Pleurodeles waltl]
MSWGLWPALKPGPKVSAGESGPGDLSAWWTWPPTRLDRAHGRRWGRVWCAARVGGRLTRGGRGLRRVLGPNKNRLQKRKRGALLRTAARAGL